MKIFLDTSSLFRLYHQEEGTDELEAVFKRATITHIYLSEIAKVEFTSAVWKKVRTKEITTEQAVIVCDSFESDFEKYHFSVADSLIVEQARLLVARYGMKGLRTLDGIQLSTCISLATHVDVFFTADKLLKELLHTEGLNTHPPV
jgi:uncharacterized protein